MVYASQNAAFRRDKHHFFAQFPAKGEPSAQFEAIEQRAQTIDYSFLLQHQQALEVEFTQMYAILQKDSKGSQEKKEAFWFYCYYCASLLEAFHRAYGQEGKVAHYQQVKQGIKRRLHKEAGHDESEETFIHSVHQSLVGGFRNVVNAPYHIAQVRDYVVYANLCRIYWVFCRLSLTQGLTIAKDLHLIDKLDALLGTHTDVDKIISTMQVPTGVINYFSVGFFLIRFMIDGGLLLKHTFFPSDLEKGAEHGSEVSVMEHLPGAAHIDAYRNSYILIAGDKYGKPALYYIPKKGKAELLCDKKEELELLLAQMGDKKSQRLTAAQIKTTITAVSGHIPEPTTRMERFKSELYKRHCNFANDLVWATVNFLTNFNQISKIPGPIAGYLTAVFLAFDVGMTLYKCQLAKEEFLTKKAQYDEEIAAYEDLEQYIGMTPKQRLLHVAMLRKQITELELSWRTKEATFYFVAAAAALLMIGFTVSMFTPPLLVAASFLVCLTAVAMYFSAEAYAQHKEKSLRLEEAQLRGEHLPMALKEYQIARNEFIFTMTKNTVMPLLLISTYAICWPAAIALTVVYLGYELFHAHHQHCDNKTAKQLVLPAPQDEEADCEVPQSALCGI